jgi:alpha-glucoside transport system substrate-binding protein
VVTLFGPYTGEYEAKLIDSLAEFEDWTGIDIQYSGSGDFETTLTAEVDRGSPPDIAIFDIPSELLGFVRRGEVVDVSTFLNPDWLARNYKQSWLEMTTMDGIMAGVWIRLSGKSQVWYPKQAFDAAGYNEPQTWEEMFGLMDQIVADGGKPWCIGIDSGESTGWPATDWIEEILLRTTSLENYDRWSFPENPDDRLLFASPEVTGAAERMAEIWFNDAYVYGGRASIADTFFADISTPMFASPPDCYLNKQGSFITSFFPEDAVAGVDFDFFYLPGIDPAYGRPYLVAGEISAMFNDRPEIRAVMDYFTRGHSMKAWMESGGALSPHNDAPLSWYGDDLERKIATLVANADGVRFDGSDIMPSQVGAGSFWNGLTDWIRGRIGLETMLRQIDASWPE